MKKVSMALVAAIGVLLSSCGGKTEVDFSIVPVEGSSGEYQYIDISQKGKIIINPQFSEAYIFRDGLALVKSSGKDGKYGYIDKKGKYVIAPTYDYAQDFGEGMAWVQIEDQPPMLIDKKGKMLLQIDSLTSAYPFSNGMTTVFYYSEGQELGKFINKKGEIAVATETGKFSSIINDDLYAYSGNDSKKWGYKNKKGETVINEQFDDAAPFFEGLAVVKSGNKYGAINKKGDFIVNPQYDLLSYDSDGLFYVKVGKKFGWIDKKGEVVINPQFDDLNQFYGNKLAPVKMGKKWAYVDRKGQIAINPQFDGALPFSGDYAMVVNSNKIGFINQKGDFVVPPLYDGSADDIKEYTYAIGQKKFGLPIWYYFELSDEKFLPYEKLNEKVQAYREAEIEKLRQKLEQEMGELAKDLAPAVTELGTEAKKWQDAFVKKGEAVVSNSYKAYDGTYFSFKGVKGKWEYYDWIATSKTKIGDCPAKSVWKMWYQSNTYGVRFDKEVPLKCESITPKIITDYQSAQPSIDYDPGCTEC